MNSLVLKIEIGGRVGGRVEEQPKVTEHNSSEINFNMWSL